MSEPQTFLDHLDELRTRIIRSCIAIGLGMLVAWAFVDRLADFVLGPTLRSLPPGSSLIFTKPGEAFSFDLDVALIFGVVFAAPFVMYQVWLFIAPALYANEKRFVVPLVVAAAISTLAGGLFSHFVLFPGMVGFFAGFRTPHVQFVPRLEDTFDLYKNMTIGMVVVFQIPTLVLFLARLRLVTAGLLWRHVKYAVLVSFIVAAVLTPSADPWNQTVFAAPMIALYLISIAIAWLARPRGDAGANDSALMRLVIAAALLRRAVARRRLIAGTSAALIALACTGLASGTVVAQAPAASDLTVYEGMRLIRGDARLGPAVEDGVLGVRNGRITLIGRRGGVTVPANATHVDLTGKTVMPALVNVHVHIGYEGYTSWGAENYTAQNVLDHLQREAFYGVGVVQSVGSSPTDASIAFMRDQAAGKFPPAARFFFMPGMAPPNGGPDEVLRRGTQALHAVYEVSTPDEARAAVRGMAAKGLKHVKIWVDDRRGTYPKMTPEVYNAVIAEAHAHGMKVQAHATTLPDQKAVVRAGVDVLVHTVQNEPLDDEFLALLREKKPFWTSVIGLGDRTEVCDDDPFVTQQLPASLVAKIRATTQPRPLEPSCGQRSPNFERREALLKQNVMAMIHAGARLMLGTDAGISSGYTFGSADHHEIARWVEFGLTPSQAIEAATFRPGVEYLGLDSGVLSSGMRADFIVLDRNPLDDIRNTRSISAVYLNGAKLDRDALLRRWHGTK
ncbi:MAG TPA: twin-arginine translocase subunit TatC [Vicinamibacterales bacterium]|nr:twin-arginine translocase subunit TatC [Vicinamibacterales bacterium]